MPGGDSEGVQSHPYPTVGYISLIICSIGALCLVGCRGGILS